MSRYDDHLPDDLHDIADRLTESRATFTPHELDGLLRRIGSRMARPPRRLLSWLRVRSAAGLAAFGLMLTSGAGVVIAATAIGGGKQTFNNTLVRSDNKAASCQYHGHRTEVHRIELSHHRFLLVIITFDCSHFIVHIEYPDDNFLYNFNDQSPTQVFGHFNGSSPPGAKSLTVTAGGQVFSFPLNV